MNDLKQRVSELSPARLALLAQRIRHQRAGLSTQTIPRRAGAGRPPLTHNQEGLWFMDQLEPDSPRFCLSGTLQVKGLLDADALRAAVNEIVRRHESLRTTFAVEGGEAVQVIAPSLEIEVPLTDLRPLLAGERAAEASRLAAEEAMRPFNLTRGPLVRARLIRLADEEHLMLLTTHHIISDGQSLVVFVNELATHYAACAEGRRADLAPLPIQYGDFAEWQRNWLTGDVLAPQLDYWVREMAGPPPDLSLPLDRPRPPVQTYLSADQTLLLPDSLCGPLADLGKETGATLFMTMLAAFFALLHRYSGQDDIVVGSPTAGRRWAETEGLVGYFVNMLALRTKFAPRMSFRELLAEVRHTVLGAYAHQDLPFSRLVAALQPERSLDRSPVFQVVFILIDSLAAAEAPGLTFGPLQIDKQTVKYDIIMFAEQGEEGIKTLLMYNADLFDHATITRMLTHFRALLEGVVARPDRPLLDIELEAATGRAADSPAPATSDPEPEFQF